MTDVDDNKDNSSRYRFSGYNLPMLQLDSTGPSYYYIPTPHPYYINQPTYWQKTDGIINGGAPVYVVTTVSPAPPPPNQKQQKEGGLYPLE